MSKNNLNKKSNSELDNLVLLRGIAVLMVCFCHFAKPLSNAHILAALFKTIAEYGKYGVQVFFVVSGFVIPLSLLKGKYSIKDYFNFLYKRLLRLQPPYLAALALTLLIMFFSYKIRHEVYPEGAISILKSLVYFHFPPDNPVFWTLMVEAQYYIFIGIFYALLLHQSKITFYILIPLLLILSHTNLTVYISLLSYIPFFLVGTVGFSIYTNTGNRFLSIATLIVLLIFVCFIYDTAAWIATFITIIVILKYKYSGPKFLLFPGKISYSIYLIHFPLGIKLINLIKPHIVISYSSLLFIITVLIILIISSWFYKFVEEFSEHLSKNIKYKAVRIVANKTV